MKRARARERERVASFKLRRLTYIPVAFNNGSPFRVSGQDAFLLHSCVVYKDLRFNPSEKEVLLGLPCPPRSVLGKRVEKIRP